jgi:hypothetical protein
LLFKGYICLLLSNGDKMLLLSCTILLWNLLGEKSMKKHFDIGLSASNVAQIWGFMELYVEHFCYTNITL